MNDLVSLIVLLSLTFAAAGIGGYATGRSVRTWYVSLPKPAWTPPAWLFAPVWTLLYIGMAMAAWQVWITGHGDRMAALTAYGVQLALNTLWSLVFFGLRAPRAGLAVIVVLWWAIVATMSTFAGVSMLAATLLAPYLAWVTFATALNAAIAARVRSARPG
jgi:tryptophan-rich sensory protein